MQAGHAPTSAELAPLVAAALRPGDAILVKGSLGSRMARIIAALPVRSETTEEPV
jgi:UDP-N-acetylmuramyl pentapeptide synthase